MHSFREGNWIGGMPYASFPFREGIPQSRDPADEGEVEGGNRGGFAPNFPLTPFAFLNILFQLCPCYRDGITAREVRSPTAK